MWIDVKQNTSEWFELRLKKATSSNFAKIMAHEGKGFGEPALKYAQRIALEIVTGVRDETESFTSALMERGHEYEPIAIEHYEREMFLAVTNGGFNHNKDNHYGDSPDGNVGEKGCVEVKTVVPNTHWKRLKKGGIDTSYKWQIQGHIWLGEKDWCDFISFCPEMPENKKLYVCRVERDEDMINRLKMRLTMFWAQVEMDVKLLRAT